MFIEAEVTYVLRVKVDVPEDFFEDDVREEITNKADEILMRGPAITPHIRILGNS